MSTLRPPLESYEYRKIAYEVLTKFKDDILQDKHARLQMPESIKTWMHHWVIPEPKPDIFPQEDALGHVNGTEQNAQAHSHASKANIAAFAANGNKHAAGSSSRQQNAVVSFEKNHSQYHPTASGINPVLLTKSKVLLEAEERMKKERSENFDRMTRTKIEMMIETLFAQAKDRYIRAGQKGVVENMPAFVQMQNALQQGLGMVDIMPAQRNEAPRPWLQRPLSPLPVPTSSSFDENSYYSSQANDWSSDSADPEAVAHNAASAAKAARAVNPLQTGNFSRLQPTSNGQSSTSMASSVSRSNARAPAFDPLHPQPIVGMRPPFGSSQPFESTNQIDTQLHVQDLDTDHEPDGAESDYDPPDTMDVDEDDDTPYSPVEIAAAPMSMANTHAQSWNSIKSRLDDTPNLLDQQAARTRKNRKKKERARVQNASNARGNYTQSAIASPPVQIKAEPVSPPPFIFGSDQRGIAGANRRGYEFYPDVEMVPPRGPGFQPGFYQTYPAAYPGPYTSVYQGYPGHPPYPASLRGLPPSPALARIASPMASLARPTRDSQGLRRVASVQAARQGAQPVWSPAVVPRRPGLKLFVDEEGNIRDHYGTMYDMEG